MAECDFVPAACEALALANCLLNRKCELNKLALPGFSVAGKWGADITSLVQINVRITELNQCILLAIAQAFVTAGCPLPTIPAFPSFDTQPCLDALQELADEPEKALGVLTDFVDIDFNTAGLPTRIRF